MRVVDPRQLDLFADGARTVAVLSIPRTEFRPQPTEADLHAGKAAYNVRKPARPLSGFSVLVLRP
jgi:hypothetical protein